jgi:CubicO group peptidase (beta-lactamase class C family)
MRTAAATRATPNRWMPAACALLCVLIGADLAPARGQTPASGPDFDALAARALSTFEVPGLALAVVKDGKTVVTKGYGVRALGVATPVDEHTLFAIASNSKVFTAAALGILVDEKKVEWDAPVVRYLPWFQMWDPWVTRQLTVRDLLVHRSGLGLGAGDLLWWPRSTYTRRQIAERLGQLQPVASFRSAYAYDNVLYLVAGEVIEAVSGQPWEDFVQARLLAPLGMTESATRSSAAAAAANLATPHARVDGTVRAIARFESDTVNPAGGIITSAADVAKWLGTFLARGQLPSGDRLYSDRTATELEAPVTPMPPGRVRPGLEAARANFLFYALGLNVRDYRGRRVLTHTGGLPGYVSRVLWMPDQRLGIAVLTNQESGAAFDALVNSILDAYLGVSDTDWFAGYQRAIEQTEQLRSSQAQDRRAARDQSSAPSLALEKYAGTYRDAWYGDVGLALEDGRLVMRFTRTPALTGDLEHWQHDTFVVKWRDRELRADAFVTFALTPDGAVDQAKMRAVSTETDFSFDFQDLRLERQP